MGGSTKNVSTAPKETAGLRQGVTQYLMGQPPATTAGMAAGQTPNQYYGKGWKSMVQMAQDKRAGTGFFAPAAGGGPQPGAASPYDRINAAAPTLVESPDQMGGANSAFFQNMMGQLQPMLTQQRMENMAAAKEGSGNLTGSGFANILGQAMNRSLGQEQATAAQYANQALGMEMDRQKFNSQLGADMSNQNAQRFFQMLMGMSTAGLGPDQLVQRGGIGSILGPIGGVIGTAAAGPIGGMIGNRVAGMFGGGK